MFFRLPKDQPPSGDASQDSEISWKLEVIAALPGPNLNIDFVVPVFNAGGIPEPEPREDPSSRYQVPAMELRESIKSKILVRDAVDGRELVFPALRNPGAALFTTLFFFGWTAVVFFLAKSSAPILFPIVFGLFAVLIGYFWFDTTFRRSHLTANRQRLVSHQSWIFFKRMKEWPRVHSRYLAQGRHVQRPAALLRFDREPRHRKDRHPGKRDPTRIEADWLASELKSALGLPQDAT